MGQMDHPNMGIMVIVKRITSILPPYSKHLARKTDIGNHGCQSYVASKTEEQNALRASGFN